MTLILGIDPGSRITGFGLIRHQSSRSVYITCGCIKTDTSGDLHLRLKTIFDGVSEMMREYQPDEVGIESVFMHKNAQAALKLGHARGVAMVAASLHCADVFEFSAREIKQAVVGYGAAKKEQVQHMVRSLLNLSQSPQSDAADALAVALTRAHTREGIGALLANQKQKVTEC